MSPEKLGQHFLTDASWLERIARSVRPDKGVCVEIGAGHGEMTTRLARHASRVIAIELDPRLARRLREVIEPFQNVEVVETDVMAADLGKLTRGQRFSVYGNLPYYITSPILEKVFSLGGLWHRGVFLVQAEVAARLAASPGSRAYGYLSVLTQIHTCPEILFEVPRASFHPPPKVDSAVIRLEPRDAMAFPDKQEFLRFAAACFRQKRKTLRNNLAARYRPECVNELPEGRLRAEQLSVEELVGLYRRLEASCPRS